MNDPRWWSSFPEQRLDPPVDFIPGEDDVDPPSDSDSLADLDDLADEDADLREES